MFLENLYVDAKHRIKHFFNFARKQLFNLFFINEFKLIRYNLQIFNFLIKMDQYRKIEVVGKGSFGYAILV